MIEGTWTDPNAPVVFAEEVPDPTQAVVFTEPPALKRGGRLPDPKWAEIAAQLSERPGEWALIKTALASRSTASDIVARIRKGAIEAFAPAGTFEATMRTDVDVFNVYARRASVNPPDYDG